MICIVFVVYYHGNNNLFRCWNCTKMIRIRILPGAYNITNLNLEIKCSLRINGDDEDGITIRPNCNTLKSRIAFADGCKVDVSFRKGLRDLLGFDGGILEEDGVYDSQRQVNIINVHSVLIRCSLISSSYLNGSTSDVLYSFSPDKPPRSLLSINPNQLVYIHMNKTESIPSITMCATDQDGTPIEFNEERTTFLFHIKTM